MDKAVPAEVPVEKETRAWTLNSQGQRELKSIITRSGGNKRAEPDSTTKKGDSQQRSVIVKQIVLNSLIGEALEEDASLQALRYGELGTVHSKWMHHVMNDVYATVRDGDDFKDATYQDICLRLREDSSCVDIEMGGRSGPPNSFNQILSLLLSGDVPSEWITSWIDALTNSTPFIIKSNLTDSSPDYTLYTSPSPSNPLSPSSYSFFSTTADLFTPAPTPNQPQLRSVKWVAYAARALVTRFWVLMKNADSADIFVVILGYVLMHLTFVRLFLNMRKMGSSFWLRE